MSKAERLVQFLKSDSYYLPVLVLLKNKTHTLYGLKNELGISHESVKTCISKLQKRKLITVKKMKKYEIRLSDNLPLEVHRLISETEVKGFLFEKSLNLKSIRNTLRCFVQDLGFIRDQRMTRLGKRIKFLL